MTLMDTRNGDIYETPEAAKKAGVSAADVVEIEGEIAAIMSVSHAVRDKRRAANKAARASRKKNRR